MGQNRWELKKRGQRRKKLEKKRVETRFVLCPAKKEERRFALRAECTKLWRELLNRTEKQTEAKGGGPDSDR